MKYLLLILLSISSSWALANETTLNNQEILGKWQYIGHYYRDTFQEPLNPNLVLTFEFNEDGSDRLRWTRLNETGFCERQGNYNYDGHILHDLVVWVHPENSFECGKDPDMQLGNQTDTKVELKEGNLHMYLPLGDEFLIYVWKKINPQ